MNTLRHTILGLFFFAALVALGFVTIYLGNFNPLRTPTTYAVYFPEVDALGAGDPVQVYGVRAGRVESVVFTEGAPPPAKRLTVTLSMERPLDLRTDYVIAIGSQNFLGGKEVDVATGTGAPLTATDWQELRGIADANLMRSLAGLIGENRADFNRIVRNLGELAEGINQGNRSILSVLVDPPAHENVNQFLASARNVAVKLDQGEGSLAQAINKPDLHDRLAGFFAKGEALLADVKDKKALLNMLLEDEALAAEVRGALLALADAAERIGRGEGLVGKALSKESEATWNDFRQLAADARALAADTRAGRGALGRLFNDPAVELALTTIVRELAASATNLSALVDTARRGGGVVGWLFADDEARRTVDRLVDQLSRAVEDAREAAPVSSVFSFLFGQL